MRKKAIESKEDASFAFGSLVKAFSYGCDSSSTVGRAVVWSLSWIRQALFKFEFTIL